MNLDNIDNIIFDLGGVICNLDYNLTIIEFKKIVRNLDSDVFYGKEGQLDFFSKYEVGKISTEDFIIEFNEYYKVDLSFEEFKRCWNAMVLDMPKQRVDLIESLKSQGKNVFLISNINNLHEEAVQDRYLSIGGKDSFLRNFKTAYYSHHIGLRKPTDEIFEHVIAKEGLVVDRSLFIDDSLHHVEAAKNLGINAIHLAKQNDLESIELLYI